MFPQKSYCRQQMLSRATFIIILMSATLTLYYIHNISFNGFWRRPSRQPKRILFYSYWKYGNLSSLFPDQFSGKCPGFDCIMVHNRSDLSQADAVVFNLNSLDLNQSTLPTRHRPLGQIWVLFSIEAPTHEQVRAIDLGSLNDLFNWTMTYRWDSDVPMPYGLIVPKEAVTENLMLSSLPEVVLQALPRRPSFKRPRRPGKKKRLVSWMVSKCISPGKREEYVRLLENHIEVHIYGQCGELKCGHRDTENQKDIRANKLCEEIIAESKFYLAFENTICPGYATEKFFRTIRLGTVPVVFGGYDYVHLAPEGSFIDALQYEPEQLGKLLLYLASNDTAYSEFFRWQDRFRVLEGFPHHPLSCGLCQQLHQLPPGALVGSHTALEQWFGDDQCSAWNENQTS